MCGKVVDKFILNCLLLRITCITFDVYNNTNGKQYGKDNITSALQRTKGQRRNGSTGNKAGNKQTLTTKAK